MKKLPDPFATGNKAGMRESPDTSVSRRPVRHIEAKVEGTEKFQMENDSLA